MNIATISDEDISELEDMMSNSSEFLRPIPTAEAEKFGHNKLRLFMHKYGLYTFPTTELIEYLAGLIQGKSAIEIGAGMGVIGRSLGIPITDNKMQEWPEVKACYDACMQPTIKYPSDIIEMAAVEAVRHYKPDIVLGSYITHKWRPGMRIGTNVKFRINVVTRSYHILFGIS